MTDGFATLVVNVRELLAGSEVDQALELLKTMVQATDARRHDTLLLLQSRYNRLIREQRKGVVTRADFQAELNQLVDATAGLLEEPGRGKEQAKSTGKEATPPEKHSLITQDILGINNLKQISWLQLGLRLASSVCRVLTPGGFGTGFLVGNGFVMTNNHVIPTANVAAQSKVEFNYQEDGSGGYAPTRRYDCESSKFRTSADLDYSLVRVATPSAEATASLSTWGQLRLNGKADPIPSDHVVIIQHPNGAHKQIVLTANYVLATQQHLLHYTTDTMPGSSGSPVFNDSWQVVAIHHAGGALHKDTNGNVRYVNEGVLMSAIEKDAGKDWPQ
jgi:V8-like Glu-specific endopeptidase